jgi:hypothetical protein
LPWPSPQDYNESVQSPRTCFRDQELGAGQLELDALGLPRPITGAFASVYRMKCGNEVWAVRCFLRYIADLQLRYSALSEFVVNDDLECTVPFHYFPQGILVNGSWYPILKMHWVEGETLDSYVRKHCYEPETMLWLAEEFAKMTTDMNNAGIAHGDLQHGNILVNDRSLTLVDYDGMYIPKLLGWSSNEIGHRNYQHPTRTEHDFGPALDNFSANLIYWSLRILAVYPFPDDLLNYEFEGLIFSREDFTDPSSSATFRFLENSETVEISSAARYLRSLLTFRCMDVPPLVTSLAEYSQPSELPPLTREQFVNRYAKQSDPFPVIEPVSSQSKLDSKVVSPELSSTEVNKPPVYSQLKIDYRAEFQVPYLAKKWSEKGGSYGFSSYMRQKFYAAGQGIVNNNVCKVRFYVIDRSASGRPFTVVISEGAGPKDRSLLISNWGELTVHERNSVLLNARRPTAGKLYMSVERHSEPVVLVMESGLPLWVFDFTWREDPYPYN